MRRQESNTRFRRGSSTTGMRRLTCFDEIRSPCRRCQNSAARRYNDLGTAPRAHGTASSRPRLQPMIAPSSRAEALAALTGGRPTGAERSRSGQRLTGDRHRGCSPGLGAHPFLLPRDGEEVPGPAIHGRTAAFSADAGNRRDDEISWMRPNWLEATWSDNGADYRVAHVRSPATATAGEPTGQTLWGLLGIAEPDDLPRSNTSLSVVGLVAWRVFIARRGGRADPVTTRTRDLVYSHRPVATDPALGGRLRLNAELRESLDRTVTDAGQLIESPDSLLRSVGGGIAHDIPEGLAVRQEAEELVRAMQRAAPRAVIHVASAALRGTYGSVPALLRDALPGASERLAR